MLTLGIDHPLAYASAMLLQVSARQKQELLSVESAMDILTQLRTIYRQEIALMKALGQIPGPEMGDDPNRDESAFSLN